MKQVQSRACLHHAGRADFHWAHRIGRCVSVMCAGIVLLAAPQLVISEESDSKAPQHAAVPANVPSAMGDVRSTLDEIVKTNEELAGKSNTKQRRAKLREIIEPRFDFEEMAKRSLGPEWPKRSKEEQAEFTDIFSELLASTYLDRVETATRKMLTVDKEKVEFPKAIVRTTVTQRGESFPIDYKLQFVDNKWRVYDVVVENIGLVANYRNEFAGIIRRDEFPGLMQKLREKSGTHSPG